MRVLLLALLASFWHWSSCVACGATVFQDGFESGSLGSWLASSSNDGRVMVRSDYSPATGSWHMILDDSVSDAVYSVAEATLLLDLSNKKNVILSYKAKSLGNEPDYQWWTLPNARDFDGVSISTDGGATWRIVQSLATVATEWEQFSIALDEAIDWRQRFGADFRIRFSEYDNAPAPLDGIAIDDVVVTADDDQRAVLELPATVLEGAGPYTGWALLAFAPTNTVTLNLLASPNDQLLFPATVQVPAGQTYASFTFSVANDSLVNLDRTVFVSAEAPGITSIQSALTIHDDDAPVATFTLPPQLAEGESPDDNASISLDRAPVVPLTLNLTANPWTEVTLPSTVTIAAGQTQAVFTVRAVDDIRIDGSVSVTIIASRPGSLSVTGQVTTIDNELRTLSLTLPSTVLEGTSATGTVVLSGSLTSNVQVTLASANDAALTVPVAVTVLAGQTEAPFLITAADNLLRDGSRLVNISASAGTFMGTDRTITIRDNEVATYRFGGLTDIVDIRGPVSITVAAADLEGNVLGGFSGTVHLSLILGDGSTQPVTPLSVNLTGATGWAGNIIFPPVNASPLRLRASDASGNAGDSIAFDIMRVLDLTAADLLWDSSRGRLYASTPMEGGGTNANKVLVIDPATDGIAGGVLTGNDPGQLALTSGGENLYVALAGNGTVARIDPTTMTVASTFAVGTSPFYGTLYAADMCTVAGQPNLLVISQKRLSASPEHNGVAVYENGVPRPTKTQDHTGSNVIEPSADPSIFFGYNTESTEYGFRRLRLDASGMTEIEVNRDLLAGFGIDIRSDGNKVFSTSGVALDGAQMRRLGTFPVRGPVCPELSANRVYFIEPEDPDDYWYSAYDKIGVYDPITFSNMRRLTLPAKITSPRSFIRWGTNGLAFITESNVVLINSSRLVASDPPANVAVTLDAAPNPAAVSEPLIYTVCVTNQGPNTARNTLLSIALSDSQTIQSAVAGSGGPLISSNTIRLEAGDLAVGARVTLTITTAPESAGTLTCIAVASSEAIDPDFTDNRAVKVIGVGFHSGINTVNRLRLAANNLIFDPTRNLLWASLPATVEAPLGKAVVSIDPATGLFSDPIRINGNPVAQCMALSANGRYLYVGLSDAPEVQRIDLNSPSNSLRIPLGTSQWGDANYAQDIEPLDGDGTSFLMAGSSDHAAAVYDGLVRRSSRTGIYSVDRIERTGTPGVFVGYNNYTSGFELSSLVVTAAGVTSARQVGNVISGYGLEIRGAGNLVLSSSGRLVDSTNLTLNANLGVSGRPCLDLDNHRAYILHESTLSGFDTITTLPTGEFALPFTATENPWYYTWPESFLRWGLDGFAFLEASGNVYIWRWSSAIPPAADANADGISDAWEATYFGALNVDPAGDDDEDGISNFQEYVFATSPVQVSGNPMHVSTATLGDQWGIRLVFPRRASLARQRYDYVISSDFTEWATAQNVSENVLSTQTVDAVQIETVEAFIPSTNRVSGFVRFRWNP